MDNAKAATTKERWAQLGRRKVDTIDKLLITKIGSQSQGIFSLSSLQTVEFGVLQHRADQSLCKRHPVKPERITAAFESDLTIRWMGDMVNITEDCIAGPFNFCKVLIGLRGPNCQAVSEAYYIDDTYWAQLEQRGPEMGVHVENIRSKVMDPESL